MHRDGQWKAVLIMVGVNFALALVNVLLKWVLEEGVNHMIVVTYRQALSTISLTPIAYYWERKSGPKITARILSYLFFSALIGATLTQYLFLLGLKYTSAAFACAFLNMVPVSTFMLAVLLRLEKLKINSKEGGAKVLGTLVCIAGAMLLTLYKGTPLASSHVQTTPAIVNQPGTVAPPSKPEKWAIGSLLLAGGSFMWSSWFLLQTKIGKMYPCQYSSTAVLSLFSAIQSAVLSLIIEKNLAAWALKRTLDIIAVVYTGVVGSGLCYVGMSWCVKQRGPVFTSAFTPCLQMFAAFLDFFFLHESIYLGSVLGSLLVIAGLYAVLWGKSKEAEDRVVKESQGGGEGCGVEIQVVPTYGRDEGCGMGTAAAPTSAFSRAS